MSESKRKQHDLELLSASLDNELSEFERHRLNNTILSDQRAVQKLNRYALVGAIMKKECPANMNTSFASEIMCVIERDRQSSTTPTTSTNPFIKQIAGLAIAVSVALVSFTSFQYFTQPDSSLDSLTAERKSSPAWDSQAPMADDYKNKISPRVQFAPAQLNANAANRQAQAQEIEIYIYNHSGYGSERIILPYAEITELREVDE